MITQNMLCYIICLFHVVYFTPLVLCGCSPICSLFFLYGGCFFFNEKSVEKVQNCNKPVDANDDESDKPAYISSFIGN